MSGWIAVCLSSLPLREVLATATVLAVVNEWTKPLQTFARECSRGHGFWLTRVNTEERDGWIRREALSRFVRNRRPAPRGGGPFSVAASSDEKPPTAPPAFWILARLVDGRASRAAGLMTVSVKAALKAPGRARRRGP